jgi:DNA-binding response OmpR family regulator
MNRATKKILVIEDDPKISTALGIRLAAAGYEVLKAEEGFAGLRMALEHRPDLVLMDIWMPVGMGFSVAQRLRSLGLNRTPIIFITASKLKGLRTTAKRLGAAAFFEKPYDSDELLAAVSLALEHEQPAQTEPESDLAPAEA